MLDYGLLDQALLVSDISATNHTALSANADVLSVPVDINTTLNATAVTITRDYLESIGMPAHWVTTADTYRGVLRTIAGCFLFLQRAMAILGRSVPLTSGALDLQMQDLAADVRVALQVAATEQGFSTTGITPTATVRTVLKLMADAWGERPILMGFTTL
jgi:hypothetical protein